MKLRLKILLGVLALGFTAAHAAFPPYAERPLKYPRYANWDEKLPTIWSGWKKRFLKNGLVQGNKPDGTSSIISEGQSYGLLLAVWMGDQETFNSIWTATENSFWNSGKNWYGWTPGDGNFAGDADIDIAGALIFASALVDSNKWTNATVGGNTYKQKAVIVLKSVMANFIDQGSNYRINSWPNAGDGIRNPSYHMPGWYPIFKEFAAANSISGMDWDKAAAGAMALLNAQPNATYGMARNFSNGSGGTSGGGTSSIGTSDNNTQDMGFDAIRVPLRVAHAAIWYPKELSSAVTYAQNVWKNGTATKGVNPQYPGYYKTSDATLIGWKGQNGHTCGTCYMNYEAFMTRAMWGALAVSVKDLDDKSAAAANQIARDFGRSLNGLDYLDGEEKTCDASLKTSPCTNYFAQSLGLMGALVMSGRAPNIWSDMKTKWTVPDTGASFKTALTATPSTIVQYTNGADGQTSTITATLSKTVPWTLRLKGQKSGALYEATGTSAAVSVKWNSLMRATGTTTKFVSEKVDARLIFPGCDTATNASARASITVNPGTGVQGRAIRGEGAVRWVDGGLILQDRALSAGDRVKATILDLNGRVASSESQALTASDNGMFLSLSSARSAGIRILELTLPSMERRRYVLSPNP